MSKQMAQDSMAMHQIALASKNIAEATKRDSHAMKTIGNSFLVKIRLSFLFIFFSVLHSFNLKLLNQAPPN